MNATRQIGFAQIPHALLLDRRLTRVDRDVAHALLLMAKRDPEISVCNRKLAALARCSVRAAQSALKRLAEAGWIGLIWGVAGRLQRRIALYFRPEHRPENRPLHVCTESPTSDPCTYARGAPPDPPPPMYPPVIPENQEEIVVVQDAPEPPPPPPPPTVAEPAPPPPETFQAPIEDGDGEKARKRAYLDATVADAEKLFGPGRRAWVVASAKEFGRGLMALRAGIRRGLEKAAGGGKVSTGYVIRTADAMRAAGGPPPELANPEQAKDDADAKCIAEMQRLEALWN